MIKKLVLYLGILLFSFLISLPVIIPYFHAGYFPTHDGEWAVVRLGDMFRELRDFQIPPRYSGELNFGYGYPLFNFAYPMPYYLGILIYKLGAGFIGSIKILFAGSVVLSAFFMFFASRALWKNTWAGIVSSILYIYFPYRMVDLYVRGSIGESLSFVLFPLLIYLVIKLISKPSFPLIGGIAVFVAVLITTHNIMTILFMPFFLVFAILQAVLKNKKAIKSIFASLMLSLGLSAFFWIPAIFEKGNILLSKIPIADRSLYFVTLNELIIPKWGYGVPTDPNGFGYQLGIIHILVFVLVAISLLYLLIKNKQVFMMNSVKIASILVIISFFYLFMMFKSSEYLWKLPLLSEINYPWIILGILGFSVSLLAGFMCKQAIVKYVAVVLGIVAVVMVLPYARPQKYINYPDSYYLTNEGTTTSSSELTPLWVEQMPNQRASKKIEILSGDGVIKNLFYNSKQINFSINTSAKTEIKINTIYYPGWKITVDKINTEISYNNKQGVMEISIPRGSHSLQASFGETPLRLASDIISLAGMVILIVFILKRNKYAIS